MTELRSHLHQPPGSSDRSPPTTLMSGRDDRNDATRCAKTDERPPAEMRAGVRQSRVSDSRCSPAVPTSNDCCLDSLVFFFLHLPGSQQSHRGETASFAPTCACTRVRGSDVVTGGPVTGSALMTFWTSDFLEAAPVCSSSLCPVK